MVRVLWRGTGFEGRREGGGVGGRGRASGWEARGARGLEGLGMVYVGKGAGSKGGRGRSARSRKKVSGGSPGGWVVGFRSNGKDGGS